MRKICGYESEFENEYILIKERIKKYPEKPYAEIVNLEKNLSSDYSDLEIISRLSRDSFYAKSRLGRLEMEIDNLKSIICMLYCCGGIAVVVGVGILLFGK